MPLDLLVPDLLLPPDALPAFRSTRLRSVERWLARADVVRHPARSAHAWLADAHGLDPLPVAALGRLGDGASTEGAWMRADPVHLRVEGDALRLHAASTLAIGTDEARALTATLQSHFAADGLEFHAASADRWYVKMAAGESPRTTALEDAVGRNVFGMLPAEAKWRTAMTEAQMILAGHEVNARRESAGQPAINSLWFWGAGALPARSAKPYALVYGDDNVARGLGAWSGAEVRPTPKGLADVDLARETDSILVAIDALSAPLARGDAVAWSAGAQEIDERWFGALFGALERFDRVRLILPAANATHAATLTRSARWRWFRPARPLSAYA